MTTPALIPSPNETRRLIVTLLLGTTFLVVYWGAGRRINGKPNCLSINYNIRRFASGIVDLDRRKGCSNFTGGVCISLYLLCNTSIEA